MHCRCNVLQRKMIFLELHNCAIQDLLVSRFENAQQGFKHERFEHTVAEFDGVIYRLRSVPNDKSKIIVSLALACFPELKMFGAVERLRREYGDRLCDEPEHGFCVSLVYDMNQVPEDYRSVAHQASLLKRHCFASLFEHFFKLQSQLEETSSPGFDQTVVHYRPEETLYIRAQSDRVTVIFSTVFRELDDVIIGKVLLQEFTEARRRYDRAPQVLYSQGTPPGELAGTTAAVGDHMAYITFVLFPRHLMPEVAQRNINLLYSLRNYLHYHIKCSKSHIHRRLQAKTAEFIKILNRARPNPAAASGASPVIQLPLYPGASGAGGTRRLGLANSSYPSTSSFNSVENGVLLRPDGHPRGELNQQQIATENGYCAGQRDEHLRYMS